MGIAATVVRDRVKGEDRRFIKAGLWKHRDRRKQALYGYKRSPLCFFITPASENILMLIRIIHISMIIARKIWGNIRFMPRIHPALIPMSPSPGGNNRRYTICRMEIQREREQTVSTGKEELNVLDNVKRRQSPQTPTTKPLNSSLPPHQPPSIR